MQKSVLTALVAATSLSFAGEAEAKCPYDLNSDGQITMADVQLAYSAYRYCSGQADACASLLEQMPDKAGPFDVDTNGLIELADVWAVYQAYINGWSCADLNPVTGLPWGVPGCSSDADCSTGSQCDFCGTSSCPACDDCVAACVPAAECYSDSDCYLFSNYCDGCTCEALASGEPPPACGGTIVQCFADPCSFYLPVCNAGSCELAPS